jgi:hypothetical protein
MFVPSSLKPSLNAGDIIMVKMNKSIQVFLVAIITVLICLISSSVLFAAERDTQEVDKFKLNLGTFIPFFNSELRVDSRTLGRGTNIDLEDRLGLDENITAFRADGYIRFYERHRLQLGYYKLSRSATTQLIPPFQFGDIVFDGVQVLTDTDIKIYEASYMYSFLQKDRLELAGTLGAQTVDIDISIIGNGGLVTESASVVGPLPVIGLDLIYKFNSALHFTSRVQIFTLEVAEYDGPLVDFRAALEYIFWENFGLGVGYNMFYIDVEVDGSRFLGDADYRFQGVNIFGVARF